MSVECTTPGGSCADFVHVTSAILEGGLPIPSVTTTSLPNGSLGALYSQSIAASGGTGSLTYAFTGTLPPGLTLNSTGELSGTPTQAGTFPFSVTVTDSAPAASGGPVTSAAQCHKRTGHDNERALVAEPDPVRTSRNVHGDGERHLRRPARSPSRTV